jgi:2-polyprenyl-3-methyl-5-hydroxy-6-metoxy-1,4-benzoquinol methylase
VKTVSSTKYDRTYFENIKSALQQFHTDGSKQHQKVIQLLHLKENDFVVDFGCGAGALTFLLHKNFSCHVLGVDYSEDAIDLCNYHNEVSGNNKISFLRTQIADLPNLENVKAVYLADVIEHLYDEEIDALMKKISTWSRKKEDYYLIIHTDNLNYLRYIRGFIDFFSFLSAKTTLSQLRKSRRHEKELHVNLMTLSTLTKKMKNYGYILNKVEYPEITREQLRLQIGNFGGHPIVFQLLKKTYNFIKYLSPSYYCLFLKAKMPQ